MRGALLLLKEINRRQEEQLMIVTIEQCAQEVLRADHLPGYSGNNVYCIF